MPLAQEDPARSKSDELRIIFIFVVAPIPLAFRRRSVRCSRRSFSHGRPRGRRNFSHWWPYGSRNLAFATTGRRRWVFDRWRHGLRTLRHGLSWPLYGRGPWLGLWIN